MKKRNSSGIVLFNSFETQRTYEWVEQQATQVFTEFIQAADYGRAQTGFYFYLYVESSVNYYRHVDGLWRDGEYCTLYNSAHLNYPWFTQAAESEKLVLTLNALLWLLHNYHHSLPVPKGYRISQLNSDYTLFLKNSHRLLPDAALESLVIKAVRAVRVRFIISTAGVDRTETVGHDLMDLEAYLNNQLAEAYFGTSIREFQLGYELFDFNGPFARKFESSRELKRYGAKNRTLLIVKQFNLATLTQKSEKEQWELLSEAILSAIGDVASISHQPKDFDHLRFKEEMQNLLRSYEKKKSITRP